MNTYPLLPPSLPEDERKADYDYEIVGDNINILQRLEDLPESNLEFCKWRIGICRAAFGSIRTVPFASRVLRDKLSHWGVYYTREQDDPEVRQKYFVLGVNFDDNRRHLLLEAVWHTPNRGFQSPKYHREMFEHEVQRVNRFEEFTIVCSFRDIVLLGESTHDDSVLVELEPYHLNLAQCVFREFRSSIVHQFADSAETPRTGYQLFTNNCQTFAKNLYEELRIDESQWVSDTTSQLDNSHTPSSEYTSAAFTEFVRVSHNGINDKLAIRIHLAQKSVKIEFLNTLKRFERHSTVPWTAHNIVSLLGELPLLKRVLYKCGMSPALSLKLARALKASFHYWVPFIHLGL